MFYYLLCVALVLVGYLAIRKKKNYPAGVPTRPGLPILGDVALFLNPKKGMTTTALEDSKKYPQIYKSENILLTAFTITDPDLLKDVMLTRSNEFINHPAMANTKTDKIITNLSLVNIRDDEWRERRRLLSPFFSSTKISPMVPIFVDNVQTLCDLVDKEGDGGIVDMKNMFSRLALDILGEAAFATQFGTQSDVNSPLAKDIAMWMDSVQKIPFLPFIPWWDKLPLKVVKDFFRGQDRLVSICRKVVAMRKSNDMRCEDLLQALIDADIKERDLIAEAVLFLIAGHETTAATLTWALYAVSQNPEIEKKIVNEVERVLQGEQPTRDNVRELQYCESVINETLRMYPPVYMNSRENSDTVELAGYTFPPGTSFFLPTWALHHNEKYWPEPEKFNPDRFAKGVHIHPGTYMPFGQGPRMCIGFKFSLMESVVALAMLYQKYTFKYTSNEPPVVKTLAFNRPEKLPMKVFRRSPLN